MEFHIDITLQHVGVTSDVHRYLSPPFTSNPLSINSLISRDLRSFVIRFDFESDVRFEIRFVLMVRFEIFESFALSIVIHKETIGGG